MDSTGRVWNDGRPVCWLPGEEMGDQGCAIIARGATVDEVISKLEERRDKINFMQQIKRVGIREEIETLVAKSGELGIPF